MSAKPASFPPDEGREVLLVEDETRLREMLTRAIHEMGFAPTAVSQAEPALRLMETRPFDILIVDLNLPGMSGEEWIAWYAQQGKQTPVVVASGKGDILTITKGNNMTAALTKPFHMEELQELIEVLLADDWHEQVSVDKKMH